MVIGLVTKLPQVVKVLTHRSTQGISITATFFEVLPSVASMYQLTDYSLQAAFLTSGYNYHFRNPVTMYGDSLAYMVQVIILMAIFPLFSKNLPVFKYVSLVTIAMVIAAVMGV